MKIDLHVHTTASPCSDIKIEDAVIKAIKSGISGIAICNHNRRFSLTELPKGIEERLNIVINPMTSCNNAFYIIPGIENSTKAGHVLTLYFSEENTISILAHPFEQSSDYSERSNCILSSGVPFDLVECGSGRANYKNKSACEMAKRFAEENNLSICAGSDAHFDHEIGNAWSEITDGTAGLCGIYNALKNGKCNIHYKNEKRVTIAKSQILKNGYSLKSIAFLIYCYIRDIGDKICQR